jgi:hypothetical protein
MYVETTPTVTGPVALAHEVAPPVPAIIQVILPIGAIALREPVTVAVNVIVPPRVGVPDATTTIVGVAAATVVVVVEAIALTA